MLCSSYDTQLKVKAEEMSMKFEKYWDGVKNINKMLIVASIFDPARKMKFTKMCFEELYGEDTVEAKLLHDSVMTLMSDLFSEYSERNRKQAPQFTMELLLYMKGVEMVCSKWSFECKHLEFVADLWWG